MEPYFNLLDISATKAKTNVTSLALSYGERKCSLAVLPLAKEDDSMNFSPEAGPALTPFIGPCAVIDLSDKSESAISEKEAQSTVALVKKTVEELKARYRGHIVPPTRYLFRTKRHREDRCRYFTGEAINAVFSSGVILIGVETTSLTQEGEKADLNFLTQGKGLLLNLNLQNAEPGINYNLLALPAEIQGHQILPARVVLASL